MKKGLMIVFTSLVFFLSACGSNVSTELISGKDTVNIGEEHILQNCLLTVDDMTYIMKVEDNPVDINEPDEYIVSYYYTVEEKTYTCERLVVVADIEPPSIELNPGVDTILIGAEWQDVGVTVSDNVSESDNISIQTEGDVNSNEAGTYQIYYMAIDEAGNQSLITRYVTVK
jgi:hypothetical protein